MKKIVLAISGLLLIASCGKNPGGFVIEGTITGDIEDGTKVFLKKTDKNNQPVEIDTTTIQDGKFTFLGPVDTLQLNFIFIDQVEALKAVVIEEGEIVVKAHKDSLSYAKVKGTFQNDVFTDYLNQSRELTERANSINKDRLSADAAGQAALLEEFKELQETYKNFELDFIKDNPNTLIGALLIDKAISVRVVDEEEAMDMYNALSPEVKKSIEASKILKQLEVLKKQKEKEKSTAIGVKAPNFSAPTPSGEQLALNDVLGKVTIVDFWAAWCRPCREENPNVVNVYKKYHDKGLNILGVSFDRRAEDWKKAIADDGLTWNHVSNVRYFDEIAQLYNVTGIPAMFVLDENGIIVAKNVRGPALEAKIAELLP